jgi:CRP-like cAMP-binding protein
MESKVQLLELVSKKASDRKEYLIELLKNVPEEIVHEVSYAEVDKNDYLVREGKKCDAVYILLKGRVVGLDHQSVGRVHSFMDFTKMYIIGDFELFADQNEYGVSVCAAEDCKLLKIPANMYLRWVKNDPNALFLRLRLIVNTLTTERKSDREFLLMTCKERLAIFLIKYYERELSP